MKETKIFSPKFVDRLKSEGYPVDDIQLDAQGCYLKQLDLEKLDGSDLSERQTRRLATATARRTLRNWTELSETDINAAAYDWDRDQKLPKILQAIGTLAQKWLANDLVPPPVTAKEVSRQTGFSPQRITGMISNFSPKVDGFGQEYRLELSDEENKPPIKKAIKKSRYESRPPGGGPVQRARFQQQRLPNQLERLAQERTRIEFFPIESQPELSENADNGRLNLGQPDMKFNDPDITEVIQYFKGKGGKKWLKGTDEATFAETLTRLASGIETDVLVWNCLNVSWTPSSKRGCYPRCLIQNIPEVSNVVYNSNRIGDALEWLACLGPINPVVLVPTNEAFAPGWPYLQSPFEREEVVQSVTSCLTKLLGAVRDRGIPIAVMRFDDYFKQRGIQRLPEEFSITGTETFRLRLTNDPGLRRKVIRSEQKYFQQFNVPVTENEIEKYSPRYFGVYIGEGMVFAEIAADSRPIILLDLEEWRVSKIITEGMNQAALDGKGIRFPIVSPLSPAEKLSFYKWKNEQINRKPERG